MHPPPLTHTHSLREQKTKKQKKLKTGQHLAEFMRGRIGRPWKLEKILFVQCKNPIVLVAIRGGGGGGRFCAWKVCIVAFIFNNNAVNFIPPFIGRVKPDLHADFFSTQVLFKQREKNENKLTAVEQVTGEEC